MRTANRLTTPLLLPGALKCDASTGTECSVNPAHSCAMAALSAGFRVAIMVWHSRSSLRDLLPRLDDPRHVTAGSFDPGGVQKIPFAWNSYPGRVYSSSDLWPTQADASETW